MGKVRIGKVKSVSNELVSKYPTVFSTDFEANKKLVYQYSDIRSKHLNNRVAGYITRLLVSQKKREEALKLEEAEMSSKEAEALPQTTEEIAGAPEKQVPTEGEAAPAEGAGEEEEEEQEEGKDEEASAVPAEATDAEEKGKGEGTEPKTAE